MAPNDQLNYSQANELVFKCNQLIRFRMKPTEEAFQPIHRLEADVPGSAELNRSEGEGSLNLLAQSAYRFGLSGIIVLWLSRYSVNKSPDR